MVVADIGYHPPRTHHEELHAPGSLRTIAGSGDEVGINPMHCTKFDYASDCGCPSSGRDNNDRPMIRINGDAR